MPETSKDYQDGFADGLLAGQDLDAADRVYTAALNRFGQANQIVVAMEELSELSKELAKQLRGCGDWDRITEEMADVYITLRQMEIVFGNAADVELAIAEKTARLKVKVENGVDTAG